MDGRRGWEEMDVDCLVQICSRVGFADRLLRVPLVCKQWRAASLDRRCWGGLDSEELGTFVNKSRLLVKLATTGGAPRALLPVKQQVLRICGVFSLQDLTFLADAFTGVGYVRCSAMEESKQRRLPELVSRWTDLWGLALSGRQHCLEQTLAAVARRTLTALRLEEMCLSSDDAGAVAKHVGPYLRSLRLFTVSVQRDDLIVMLRACHQLDYLVIADCSGFSDDPELMESLSGVEMVIYER